MTDDISNGGLEMGEENDGLDFREDSLGEKIKSFPKVFITTFLCGLTLAVAEDGPLFR